MKNFMTGVFVSGCDAYRERKDSVAAHGFTPPMGDTVAGRSPSVPPGGGVV
jgi:hypothetical protein